MTKGVTVDFNANIARFTGSVDKAINDLNRFQSNASRISGNITKTLGTLGVGLSVGAFASFIKGAIDAADKLNDLSKSTGLAVETLAGLDLASRQSGGDLDSVADSINKLSVNIGKNSEKFRELGITSKDPLEAFKQLADIFNSIEDPQQRAALAAEALGKSWAGAAPLLAEGSKNIGEMVKKGTELSGMNKEAAEKADAFNDKLEELNTISGRVGISIGVKLIPGVTKIISLFDQATSKTNDYQRALARLNLTAIAAPSPATGIRGAFELANRLVNGSGEDDPRRVNTGKITKNNDANAPSDDLDKKVCEFSGGVWDGKACITKKNTPSATKTKKDQLTESISNLKVQSAELGKTGVELELFRLKTLGASEAQLRLAESMLVTIDNFKDAKEVTDSVKSSQDTYNETLEQLNRLQEAGVISTETYERALSKAANTFAETDTATKAAIDSAKKLNELLEQTPTGQLEKSREEMLFLGAAFDEGKISAEQFLEAVNVALGRLPEQIETVKSEMDVFAETAARNIQSAFADFLFDPFKDGLDGMLQGFADMMQRMIAEAIAANLVKSIFGAAGGGEGSGLLGGLFSADGLLGGLFGGGKAIGGDVSPSQMYMVGEKGPELFVPRTAGSIVPNNKLSGGGMSVTNVFHVSGPADMRTQQQIASAAYSGALRAARRNG